MDYYTFEFTMHYECLIKLPDGTITQVQGTRKVNSEWEANTLIAEWNRIAKITKGIEYNYRRLS